MAATLSPRASASRAVAWPKPLLAPVMNQILSGIVMMLGLCVCVLEDRWREKEREMRVSGGLVWLLGVSGYEVDFIYS